MTNRLGKNTEWSRNQYRVPIVVPEELRPILDRSALIESLGAEKRPQNEIAYLLNGLSRQSPSGQNYKSA